MAELFRAPIGGQVVVTMEKVNSTLGPQQLLDFKDLDW